MRVQGKYIHLRRGRGEGDKMTRRVFAALVAGSLALALGACGGSSDPAPAETAPAESAEQGEAAAEEQAEETKPEPEESAPETKYPTTIDGVRLGKDYSDEDVAIVTYTWTNNSDDTTSFAFSVNSKVFQNGIECDPNFFVDEVDSSKYSADVRPGTTITVEMAYNIEDLSDIEVEVEELFSFSDEKIAEAVLPLS